MFCTAPVADISIRSPSTLNRCGMTSNVFMSHLSSPFYSCFRTGHGIAASIHKLLLPKQQGTFCIDCSRLKGCLWALLYKRFLYLHGADGGLCTGSLPWPGEYKTMPIIFSSYMIPVLQLRAWL